MSNSKRRKVDLECRNFQEKWTYDYLFTEVNKKPICLVCSQQVSVYKEYNIQRHYKTNHSKKFDVFQGKLRSDKIKQLLSNLERQQTTFNHNRDVSESALKASYYLAMEIAKESKPFSDGEFIKKCIWHYTVFKIFQA